MPSIGYGIDPVIPPHFVPTHIFGPSEVTTCMGTANSVGTHGESYLELVEMLESTILSTALSNQ
eukprot:6509832-Ditylum_brightwellii.AAC.1